MSAFRRRARAPSTCASTPSTVNGGAPLSLGCRSLDAKSGSPAGQLESVTPCGRRGRSHRAGPIRPRHRETDVACMSTWIPRASPCLPTPRACAACRRSIAGYGTAHGFSAKLSGLARHAQRLRVRHQLRSGRECCSSVARTSSCPAPADLGRAPFGNFDSVTVSGGTAVASGWAIDPDTTASVGVHLYVGSVGKAIAADKSRPDVEQRLSRLRPEPRVRRAAVAAERSVRGLCLCHQHGHREPHLPRLQVGRRGVRNRPGDSVPFGNLESLAPAAGGALGVRVGPGSRYDRPHRGSHLRQTPSATHFSPTRAGPTWPPRTPATVIGTDSAEFIAMAPGSHTVCVYAINNGAGGHALIGMPRRRGPVRSRVRRTGSSARRAPSAETSSAAVRPQRRPARIRSLRILVRSRTLLRGRGATGSGGRRRSTPRW